MRSLIVVFAALFSGLTAGVAAAQAAEGATALDRAYEAEVEAARRRYEAALKRWNDLK